MMGARWRQTAALFLCLAAAGSDRSEAQTAPGLRLAVELSGEGDHPGAALEFRRLAADEPKGQASGSYYWAAAFEYWKAGETSLSDKMLDRAEDADPSLGIPALLLRGENARAAQKWTESAFYFESVLRGAGEPDEKTFASRRLATTRLRRGDPSGAAAALALAPVPQEDALAALDRYQAGRDKSPGVGGLLGLIPGCGYFYAGEWANGFRSLILNGLFLFGMVNTADRDQWGAFAVITFFEFTWYSGSIYGGIDAAHRHNRDRLEEAVQAVNGGAGFEPDYAHLPMVSLKYQF